MHGDSVVNEADVDVGLSDNALFRKEMGAWDEVAWRGHRHAGGFWDFQAHELLMR
jgi:hypothetical protein